MNSQRIKNRCTEADGKKCWSVNAKKGTKQIFSIGIVAIIVCMLVIGVGTGHLRADTAISVLASMLTTFLSHCLSQRKR